MPILGDLSVLDLDPGPQLVCKSSGVRVEQGVHVVKEVRRWLVVVSDP
jgi:hypothetical protein